LGADRLIDVIEELAEHMAPESDCLSVIHSLDKPHEECRPAAQPSVAVTKFMRFAPNL
jgi:hypothetical protein